MLREFPDQRVFVFPVPQDAQMGINIYRDAEYIAVNRNITEPGIADDRTGDRDQAEYT